MPLRRLKWSGHYSRNFSFLSKNYKAFLPSKLLKISLESIKKIVVTISNHSVDFSCYILIIFHLVRVKKGGQCSLVESEF